MAPAPIAQPQRAGKGAAYSQGTDPHTCRTTRHLVVKHLLHPSSPVVDSLHPATSSCSFTCTKPYTVHPRIPYISVYTLQTHRILALRPTHRRSATGFEAAGRPKSHRLDRAVPHTSNFEHSDTCIQAHIPMHVLHTQDHPCPVLPPPKTRPLRFKDVRAPARDCTLSLSGQGAN